MPGGSDVSNDGLVSTDDERNRAEFDEAPPGESSQHPPATSVLLGLSEYLVFIVTVVSSLVVTDYSKTPLTMYAAVAVGLIYLLVPPSSRRALCLWRSGQALEADEEAAQVLPVVVFAGTGFLICLLWHAVADPAIAPDVYAIVYEHQAALLVTWFVLGFLGGAEAADPPLKVIGATQNGVIAWIRTLVLDRNLPELVCTQQFDVDICLPSLRQLAIRCQLAPCFIGFLLGWLSRAKWHAWNQVALHAWHSNVALKCACEAFSCENSWLRSHSSYFEDARRDDLIRKELLKLSGRVSPCQQVQEAAAEPQPDRTRHRSSSPLYRSKMIMAWAARSPLRVDLPPPNRVGKLLPSSSVSSTGRRFGLLDEDASSADTTQWSAPKSRPRQSRMRSPRDPKAPLPTIQEKAQ